MPTTPLRVVHGLSQSHPGGGSGVQRQSLVPAMWRHVPTSFADVVHVVSQGHDGGVGLQAHSLPVAVSSHVPTKIPLESVHEAPQTQSGGVGQVQSALHEL